MKLKEFEHEGTEEFSNFPDRKKVAKAVKKDEKKKEKRQDKLKEELQKKWLSVNNPFIFEGDWDA